MTQSVVCKKGRCYEPESFRKKFSDIIDRRDLLDQIEYDLLDDMIN